MPTGQLLRLYRIDRKKTTVNVATHAGITVRYLEMIEAGTKTPSLPVLRKLAKVLGVRTSALIGEAPSESHEEPLDARLAEIERALITYRSIGLTEPGTSPDLLALTKRVNAAWQSWFTSPTRYSDVLQVLPGLIVDAEHVIQATGRSPEAFRQASEVYQLARSVVITIGQVDLGGVVSDRAMRYAEETDDPLLIAAAIWNLAHGLLADDKPSGALDLAMKGSKALEKSLPNGAPEHFSLYGGLLLVAAIAAGRTGDPWRGRELLRGPARKAAQRVGSGKNFHHMIFGPENLGIHVVNLEYEAGEISAALRFANEVDITTIPCLGRQVAHLAQVARVYECKNNDTAVFVHLKMAERLCSEDFLYKRTMRNMVTTLVKRAKPSYASEVREFAGRIGLLN
jgi:transcriptional regulator with XRE-family HTH domain